MSRRPDAATVLLALLERIPDAHQVERLLEAENLRHVLNQCGQSDADIRAALKTKMPGELLLGLLEGGRTGDELLALLPPPGPSKSAAAVARVQAVLPRPSAVAASVSSLNKAGGIGALVAVIVPAMILSGFFPLWNVGSPGLWYGIATGGAALGGALFAWGRHPAWLGAFCAALAAPGALFVMQWWTADRETIWNVEIAAACGAGALPGIILYNVLARRAR
ncbi:MAG: hypothetical protein KC549_11985 [Myxococcales bacterium]|nr:hypothetical protein [Myxococcales bacterium]